MVRGAEEHDERGVAGDGVPAGLDPGCLNDLAGHLMRHAFLRAQQVFAEVFDGEGLTSLQFMVLELVDRNPGIAHREVADAMSSVPSVMTTAMRPLVEDGTVIREPVAGDRRKVAYRLSDAGRARFRAIRPRIARAERELLAGLDAEDVHRLKTTLRRISGRPASS